MSSFKGLLHTGKPSVPALKRLLNAVLAGISGYTVDGQDQDLSMFRESMLGLATQLQEQASSVEVDTTVNHALELLRDYNVRALKFHQTHTNELRAVMRTMTDTITYLSESRTRSVHQLQFMERELEQALQIDDIRLLRARLITCLDVVREETGRLQSEAQARSQEVRQQIGQTGRVVELPARLGTMDNVTGLPSRRPAERSIADILAQGGDHAVAVFVVSLLNAINSKYGRAVGDEVMLRVANHFAQHLSSQTYLYHWSGPALVAIIDVHHDTEDIRRSWAKTAAVKQEVNLSTKQRTVFLVVETVMSFQIVNKQTPPDDFFRELDRFVADQSESVGPGAA
jgi:GGDEF domain-containing protein